MTKLPYWAVRATSIRFGATDVLPDDVVFHGGLPAAAAFMLWPVWHSQTAFEGAKAAGCRFRTGPELEVTGYGCEDSFLEGDTFLHAWESLVEILSSELTDGILCDIGMPVMHRNVSYNCRVICLNRKILGIRPKFLLANDGNYREMRYFTPWYIDPATPGFGALEDYALPPSVCEATGQKTVPIGIFAVSAADTAVGFETCEELFTPQSPHIEMSLDGIEIIANGSGSHHQLRKLDKRIDLVGSATAKCGGVYLYANQKGCDGGRLYFDGCSMVWVNFAARISSSICLLLCFAQTWWSESNLFCGRR